MLQDTLTGPVGIGRGDRMTYKGADGRQELRLHGLLFREPTPHEDRVVGNLVGDFVRKASERRRRSNERR